jgi:hypothetical protein
VHIEILIIFLLAVKVIGFVIIDIRSKIARFILESNGSITAIHRIRGETNFAP